jgi:hypothetical protein
MSPLDAAPVVLISEAFMVVHPVWRTLESNLWTGGERGASPLLNPFGMYTTWAVTGPE